MVCRSLRKLPGKVGLGDIRLTPEMGKIDALETSLQTVLSKGGVSVIDTAGVYDHGQTEETVGKVLQTVTSPEGLSADDFFLISKFGYRSNEKKEITYSFDVEAMNEDLETSRQRLGVPTLDAFLFHEPEEALRNAYPFPPPNDEGVVPDIELDPRERDEFLQGNMFQCINSIDGIF